MRWANYQERDFVVMGVLSAAAAVAYAGLGQIWAVLTAATGPLGGTLIGLFQFGHVLAGCLIRRPGSVLIVSVLSTVIQAFLGDPAGFYVIGWGVTHGIGAELVFLLSGAYQRPTWFKLSLASGVAAVCGHFFSFVLYGWEAAMSLFIVSVPIVFIFSGLESGSLAHWLHAALLRAGLSQRPDNGTTP